jgi:hypothetical protein
VPHVPAICPNGHVFDSGFFIENSSDITFVGSRSQCPKCGARGVIPDGVYDAVGETLNVVAAGAYSREQLERVAALLGQAQSERMDPSDLADALDNESPEIANVVRRYLVPRNPGDVYAFLGLLVALIALWLALHSHGLSQPQPSPAQAAAAHRAGSRERDARALAMARRLDPASRVRARADRLLDERHSRARASVVSRNLSGEAFIPTAAYGAGAPSPLSGGRSLWSRSRAGAALRLRPRGSLSHLVFSVTVLGYCSCSRAGRGNFERGSRGCGRSALAFTAASLPNEAMPRGSLPPPSRSR